MGHEDICFARLLANEFGSLCFENRQVYMNYIINDSDFGDFIIPVTGQESAIAEQDKLIKLATPKGIINYTEHDLADNLSILQGHYSLEDDVMICGKGAADLLEIQFNLSADDIFYYNKPTIEQITPKMTGNISYLAQEENKAAILFKKDVSYTTFDVHLPCSFLNKFAGESKCLDCFLRQIEHNRSCRLLDNGLYVNAQLHNTICHIKQCPYRGLTKKIYLESKIYELIAFLVEGADHKLPDHRFTKADMDRIYFAASLIRNNLKSPFTIQALAREVGMNQTKLKNGFKTIIGNTVFGYLQEIRMKQAEEYLTHSDLSIQEIAYLSGYQNASNFSAAFKTIYGYSPNQLRIKLKGGTRR